MHKAMLPCSTFRGMNWDRQRHEKDGLRFVELKRYGSQHYIFRCHDMPHLHNIEVLKTEIIKRTAYKFGAIQTSIFYYKICFCPQKFSNSFLPDMRRLTPRKASTKKEKKSITSNSLTPPSTNPAALYEANEFLHQHIECYIAWWMLMAATSL